MLENSGEPARKVDTTLEFTVLFTVLFLCQFIDSTAVDLSIWPVSLSGSVLFRQVLASSESLENAKQADSLLEYFPSIS